jgi:hypothetical protein
MKHILNNISQEEKQTILEQHSGGKFIDTSSFKRLLESKLGNVKPLVMEQNPGAQAATPAATPAFPTSGVEKDTNFPVDQNIITSLKVNTSELTTKVQVSFNHDTGVSTAMLVGTPRTGPATTWKSSFGCKCPTNSYSPDADISPTTQTIEKTSGFGGTKEYVKGTTVSGPMIDKWIKERCIAYLKDKKCGPVLATRPELNALYQRTTPADLQVGDKKTICTFVRAKQGNIGMEGHTDKQKIMDNFLSNFAFYAPGTDRKTFDNISSQDFSDKGELFCKGWGI